MASGRNAARGASATTRSAAWRTCSSRRASTPADLLGTMTAAASLRSRARSRWPNFAARPFCHASGSCHGARSSSDATMGMPEAIGRAPAAAQ